MPTIVTFYNNKGGVSKTTTGFNVGVYLTQKLQKKVLLLDADPQSNMTELFTASTDFGMDSELPGTSLYAALEPRFRGDAGRVDVKSVALLNSGLYEGLSLLRGDFSLGMAETYLATAAAQAITENVNEKQTYLVFHRLLADLIAEYGFDHIIVDVGPSVGALSRMAVLSTEAFFVPITPDRFCLQAISVLSKVLGDWKRRHQQIIETFEPYGLETFPGDPRFLGAVSQNFKAWAGKAKQSYKNWEDKIGEALSHAFDGTAEAYVAQIRDVGPIAPIAQMFGRAIFDIRQSDTTEASTTGAQYYGAVWDNWRERMTEYEQEVAKIASAVVGNE